MIEGSVSGSAGRDWKKWFVCVSETVRQQNRKGEKTGKGKNMKGINKEKESRRFAHTKHLLNRPFRSDNRHPFHIQPVFVRACERLPSFVDVNGKAERN